MKIEDFIKNEKMTGVDGIERNVKDHFAEKDFVTDANSIFVYKNGLQRVVRQCFNVEEYKVVVIDPPSKSNDWCCVVKAKYSLSCKIDPNRRFVVESVADCRKDNAGRGFAKYSTALAETRAGGRAERTILGINACTKEEVASDTSVISDDENQPIADVQIKHIEDVFFKQRKNSLKDIVDIVNKEISSIKDLTKGEAAKVIKTLNSKKYRR